jgi:chaperonin GroES
MKKSKSKAKPAKKTLKKAPKKTAKAVKPANKAGVTPLGDRILVKPIAQETTTSFGIIIPDTAKEKPETGMVVAVGEGRKTDSGAVLAVSVKVGDKVMFSKYGYDEIKVQGVEYFLVPESSILAILN